MIKKIFITGGSGFIGSSLIKELLINDTYVVINYDKLTYASKEKNNSNKYNKNYFFIKGDIKNRKKLKNVLCKHKPDGIINLAAESHVDKSIDDPSIFIKTNILGTFNLLEEIRAYWKNLNYYKKKQFRFVHVSTDEVYGSINNNLLFNENSPYNPSSPYSASKASSDHLVKAWFRTYNLPTIITNCSNNYGPNQLPEKLIPLMILNALNENWLPVYGNGKQIRDWIYVDDHSRALIQLITKGKIGETYNIGARNEKTNIELVNQICKILNEIGPGLNKFDKYEELIKFVKDRPGHDLRYAINNNKLLNATKWKPKENFNSGLKKTVKWYLNEYLDSKLNKEKKFYKNRLGLKK